MDRAVVATGEAALQLVRQSHRGNIEHVQDMAILHYMNMSGYDGRFLTLWTTLYPNDTTAYRETMKMVEGMRRWGSGWASNLEEITIADKRIYTTSPDGITYHYFWADHKWVFYIVPHNFTQDEVQLLITELINESEQLPT